MANALRLYALKGVVTGASEGIGEAVARTFVKHGAEVLAADSSDSRIDTTFTRVRGITAVALDADPAVASRNLAGAVRERLEGLDILVNNYPELSDFAAESGKSLQPWLDRIVTTTAALLPLLKKSPAGRIINMGALISSFGPGGQAELEAAEKALADLTASQAAEYGQFGITANYIQPGAIMTPSSRAVFDADKSFRDWCIARSAARRLGEPIDVAKVALFLASDDSVFVSGTGITANGGILPAVD
jgi:NAD(P)-dependent dehydrogenase (short-subunit alcohol dehydrogenase family)